MAIWWMTEALPIAVTALLPLALFPVLGIAAIGGTASPYADPVIFLFLGGFVIARAFEQCGLHRRVALAIMQSVGTRPASLVFGVMAATALISMWVSNTATAIMMYPIAMSVVALAEREGKAHPDFPTVLLLGVAYSASIGGLGTLVGTPPNALFAGFVRETYQQQVGFAQWMLLGVPLVLVITPLTWLLLVKVLHPLPAEELSGGRELIRSQAAALGPMSRAEWTVAAIVLVTTTAWMTQPLLGRVIPGLSDAGIAIAGALLTLAIPVDGGFRAALRWEDAEKLPWSVLILFGGGLSLAAAIGSSGLARSLAEALQPLQRLPVPIVIVLITIIVVALSELASNTATAATFLPIVGAVAVAMGVNPILFAAAATVAASGGFMLPVATPPNAIVFASGRLSIPQMIRAGVWLDLLFLLVINVGIALLAGRVFD